MSVAERLGEVRSRIEAACARVARDPGGVELLAVTKTFPAEVIREAVDAGHRLFGESRQQEAEAKIPRLPSSLRWHFIGHLQRNKVRKVLPLVEALHSIDSLRLAQQVDRVAAELGLFPKVFLEVNVGSEGSKHGFREKDLRASMAELLGMERLEVLGLMAIPPFVGEPELARPWFAGLRGLRDRLQDDLGVPLPGLSMGMSGDFEVAIEEGASIVRVGSSIFGSRAGRRATDGMQ
jgi:pyridoxal phosphate enzyme (YggS family)